MRRDWTERLRDWGIGYAVGALVMALLVWVFSGCVLFRPWAPTGVPGCPNKSAWSDSAQKCIPKEGTQ